jgi:hypothetical protein
VTGWKRRAGRRAALVATSSIVLMSTVIAVGCGGDDESDGEQARVTTAATTTSDGRADKPGQANEKAGKRRQDARKDSGTKKASPEATDVPDDPAAAEQADEFVDPPSQQSADADERAAADTVVGMYRAFAAGDAAGVCAVMSRKARADIARSMPNAGTCTKSFALILKLPGNNGPTRAAVRAKVGDARIDGDRATVTVTIAGKAGEVGLVRESGRWLLNGPAPTGQAPAAAVPPPAVDTP